MEEKVKFYDMATGELIGGRPDCPFRSLTDLKGYNDDKFMKPGSSMVDLTGYEPLSSIISRCMRVQIGPNGQQYQVLDKGAMQAEASFIPAYEASQAKTIDEAFETLDHTQDPGYDLADATQALMKSQATLSTGHKEADILNQADEVRLVGNSRDKSAKKDLSTDDSLVGKSDPDLKNGEV